MKIIDIALSQEGTPENGLNNILYNKWYYGYSVSGGSYPYCAVFVSWCADQAGLIPDVLPKTASVTTLYNFFLEKKQFKKNSGYIPSPGDIMIQRSNGASHTGIVVMADDQGFYTIEGNAGAGVERQYHHYYENTITGFGTPNYPMELVTKFSAAAPITAGRGGATRVLTTSTPTNATDTTVPVSTNTSPQMTEEEIWDWLRIKGYEPEAAAGIMAHISLDSNYSPIYETIRAWNNTVLGGMGMFRWTWDGPVEGILANGYANYPNSTLSKYHNWCTSQGFPGQEETCLAQLNYFANVDGRSYSPSVMNTKSVSDAASYMVRNYFKTPLGNEIVEAQRIYEQYKSRQTPGATSSTGQDMRTDVTVQEKGGAGLYSYETYTVKSGDTLESIAARYNISPQMILFTNNRTEWQVAAGEVLHIPIASGTLTQAEATSGAQALAYLTNTRVVKVSHPTVEVHFYGEYGKLAAKSTLGKTEQNDYMDFDIISVNTTRNMGQDCPTFTMSLVRRNKWYDNIASNDLVIIFMQRPPEAMHVVMYGLVDDIRRSMDWSSGQPQATIQVTGRGFNKALCCFDVGLINNFHGINKSTSFFSTYEQLIGGNSSSAECIQLVLDAFLDKGMKYQFGDGKTFKDHYVYQGTALSNERLFDQQSFQSFNDNLWNFIKKLTNSPWNETYWEIMNDKPTLIHRPTPFEKAEWTALVQNSRKTIKDYEIVANNTGRSDLETYTVYMAEPVNMPEISRNIFLPFWYPPYYHKYGLREHRVSTLFFINEPNNDINSPVVFTRKLFNFYIKNSVSENGQLTVIGSNQYKVGTPVILESEDMEYYVEGVSHSFNMYSNWTTTLSVTRGLHPNERFTAPYGAYEDLTQQTMENIIRLTYGQQVEWWKYGKDGTTTTEAPKTTTVSVGGDWYSFRGLLWTHPSPQAQIVTSPFGQRSAPMEGASTAHQGIDLSTTGGSRGLPIVAAADGTVDYAGPARGYGYCIDIIHSGNLLTRYAHIFPEDIMVSQGQKVTAGQQIAKIGSSGIATGPHLHFELREGGPYGTAINPEQIFEVRAQSPTVEVDGSDSDTSTATIPYSAITVTSSPDVETIPYCYSYLKGEGFNKCAVCAILGCIQQASEFKLADINKTGEYGMLKWSGARHQNLKNYCLNNNLDRNSLPGQLGFLIEELNGDKSSSKSILTSATNDRDHVYQVAIDFGSDYMSQFSESCGTYAVEFWDELE